MNAADTLTIARQRSGRTLRDLAQRADTSHSTLAAYEAGRVTPSVNTLHRLVRSAGFDLVPYLPARIADPARGDELLAVLVLAAQFPARHAATLDVPPFGRRCSARP